MEERLPHLQHSLVDRRHAIARTRVLAQRTRAFVPRPDFRPPRAGNPVVLRGTVATSRSRGGFQGKTMIGAIASAVLPSLLGGVGGSNGSGSAGGGLLSGIGGIANSLTGGLLGGVTKTLGGLFGG
jgi:hypothetical protein